MGRINIGRVLAGGLLAGLIINVGETILNLFVIAEAMDAALQARNLPPVGGQAIAVFVLLCFALGVGTVWLYAAMRPRFGPGAGTAVLTGVAVWSFAFLFPGIGNIVMQLFPPGPAILALVWGLAEMVVAALAGGRVYNE
jgi:hypothetical protein